MNRQIAQLQDSDPEFARTLKRLRIASYGLAAAIVLAAGLGLWAVVVNSEQATQITKIQKTPCTLAPEGKACTTIKERIARHGSLKNPCIEHQRVEGTRGRNCPHFYVQPSRRQVQANSKEIQNLEQAQPGIPNSRPVRTAKPGGKVGTHKGTSGGTKGGAKTEPKSPKPTHHAKSSPAQVDTPADISPATSPPETASSAVSEPGNSGETPAATNGVKACVDLAVSACVKSELEVPLHLP